MKTKNLLMLLAIAGIMVFASCKKDEGTPDPLTKDEAVAAFTTVDTDYAASMDEFDGSDGNHAIEAVDGLGLPFGGMKAPINSAKFQKDVLKVYNPSIANSKGGPFFDINFTENVGTWHKVEGIWTKTPDQTDKIIVIFSYNEGVDNGTLTYYDYAEKTVTIDGASETYMSSLSAKVDIVGATNPVAAWDYTASLSGTATSAKMAMKFVYTMGVYSQTQALSISMSQSLTSGTATMSMLEELKKNGSILKATSVSMSMSENQNGYSSSINAKFRIKNIIIKWDINIDENTNFEGDPSLFQTISVWTADGAKVADVVFVLVETYWIPYFKFADGTTAPISEYLSENLYYEILDFEDSIMDFGFKK